MERDNLIFDIIENFISQRAGYMLHSQPNDMTMSIKSPLQYHYRPTIRYEVEMYRMPKETIGQLKILYRTQSPELLVELTRFFKIWMRLEELYISNLFDKDAISYGLENGKFTRTFAVPNHFDYSEKDIGNAIGNYIATFDEMLKTYLDGKYTSLGEMESRYLAYLNGGAQLI